MNITTLEQAATHLIESGKVDMQTMTIDGRQLLEVCGLDSSKGSQSLKRQIDRHGLVEGKDFFPSMGKSSGGRPSTVYQFTLNAANHILLAAMTAKGKAARQEAIDLKQKVDSVPFDLVERMMSEMAANLTSKAGESMKSLSIAYDEKIKERNILIYKKSEPISLMKMYGRSHKTVQAANFWLEEKGYQEMRFVDGKRRGWRLLERGRELGIQVSDASIFWVPEIKKQLPPTSELIALAESMGLKDMTKGR